MNLLISVMEISKTYNPEESEASWYETWNSRGYFKPSPDGKGTFSMVIPPPNVTGSLHMGHALNSTLQDILTRWHRMRGDRTVWVPGTDHGGIATQNVVEKMLRAEKKTRYDLGREAFLKRMWSWRQETGDTILMQLRRLGVSCDWSRTRFTMDEECSKAVRYAFVALFKKGLIYRGPRMVNWCPRCNTALSDIEVEHESRPGKLWHIRYLLADAPDAAVVVATTRPETLLGDQAVAVNPEDPRYQGLIGKSLRLPLTRRTIPVIADAAVEASFGTGAVKVTPAHDPTDFEIGERHHLAELVVIGFDGKMTPEAGPYAGLDRFEARQKMVEALEAQGLLEKTEPYTLNAAVCYRCGTIIEPLVSEQWFMTMSGLASRAAQATRDGKVKIFPASWEKPYLLWLDNIRDWCISRQIWWGHRIPVYYCQNSAPDAKLKTSAGNAHSTSGASCRPIASIEKPASCPGCASTELTQDHDVLDTWFSSALWPMSVFGWPEQTSDLEAFYPTSVLVTGHEILYLWVARMVMMGLEFQNDVPFRDVYIHGIVRDKQGKKMSKSLGNVIDPLEIMKQYGTDALRFSIAGSSVPGRDMQLSNDSFLKARNFANKLWNASRFVMLNLEGYTPKPLPSKEQWSLADRWILHELQDTIDRVDHALTSYNPAEACRALYEFIWGVLCDWYLEISKVDLTATTSAARPVKQAVLVHVLNHALALLHPFMPYETEALYQALKPFTLQPHDSLMIASWPTADAAQRDQAAADQMRLVQSVVTSIRTLRSEAVIHPGTAIRSHLRQLDSQSKDILSNEAVQAFITSLARLEILDISGTDKPEEFLFTVFGGGEIYVEARGLIDKSKETARLKKNIQQFEQMRTRGNATLSNKDFMARAPKEEVENLQTMVAELGEKIERLTRNLEGLS